MTRNLATIKQDFVEGLSHMSRFWGFPKGVGAVFGVLYLSPAPLSLDEIVRQTGLTKGAISTNVRALARMGLVHLISRLGDRKDYYEAETDFYRAIRAILGERQNAEFARSILTVREALADLKRGGASIDPAERKFLVSRLQALQDFFEAIDSLARSVSRLESLGFPTVRSLLSVLKK